MLLGDAGTDYTRSVKQARRGAGVIEAGINRGRESLNENLAISGLSADALPETADARRIQQTQAAALNELDLRGVQAQEGAASGVRQAGETYAEDAGKIRSQLSRLISDRDTYTAGLLDQLIEGDRNARRDARAAARTQQFTAEQKALDRDTRITSSLVSQGIAPDGTPIPGGKADPNSPKNKKPKFKWSETEQRDASDTIEKALSYVRKGDPGTGDVASRRAAIAKTLVEGIPGKTDPLTGEKSGGVPSLPAIYVSAALDLYFGKALSRKTVRRLHDRGVKIKPLGYPTFTKPRQHSRPGNAPSSAPGQQRPT